MSRKLLLSASLLLLSACPSVRVIPDAYLAHEIAEEAEVTIWVATDGKWVKEKVKIPTPGWWVGGPPSVGGKE
jgi:hypothetical protein